MKLIFMGIKHCGKSVVGTHVAQLFAIPFFDMDDLVIANYGSNKETIRDIYIRSGKERFQEMETESLVTFFSKKDENWVFALGGGIADNPTALTLLKDNGVRIYLHDTSENLFQRIIRNGVPPFLDPEKPEGSFRQLYKRRDSLYRANADVVFNREGVEIKESATAIYNLVCAKYQ